MIFLHPPLLTNSIITIKYVIETLNKVHKYSYGEYFSSIFKLLWNDIIQLCVVFKGEDIFYSLLEILFYGFHSYSFFNNKSFYFVLENYIEKFHSLLKRNVNIENIQQHENLFTKVISCFYSDRSGEEILKCENHILQNILGILSIISKESFILDELMSFHCVQIQLSSIKLV
jgi:hypothetical protein